MIFKKKLSQNQQEPASSNHKSKLKKVIWFLVFIILIGGIIGSYFFLTAKYNRERTNLQTEIKNLEEEINNFKSKKTEKESSQETNFTQNKTPGSTSNTTTKEESCTPTLTEDEKATISSWKTFTNSYYNYSFKYPEDWRITKNENNEVVLEDSSGNIKFWWASEEKTIFGLEDYIEKTSTNIVIACQEVVKHYMVPKSNEGVGSTHFLYSLFEKNNKKHMASMYFKYAGASLSSDIVDLYNLILKTIEFK